MSPSASGALIYNSINDHLLSAELARSKIQTLKEERNIAEKRRCGNADVLGHWNRNRNYWERSGVHDKGRKTIVILLGRLSTFHCWG